MFRHAFVLRQEDNSYLVYPQTVICPAYLLNKGELEVYLDWLRDHSSLKFAARDLVVGLGASLPILLLVLVFAWIAPQYSMSGLLIGLIGMFSGILYFANRQFRAKFPRAPRVRANRPWRRVSRGMLVSRPFLLWKCVVFLLVNLALVLFLVLFLLGNWRAAPWAHFGPDMFIFISLTYSFWLLIIAVSGYFIAQHLRFRTRYHRAPRPVYLDTLLRNE